MTLAHEASGRPAPRRRGVSQLGMDVYDVEFENHATEWGFSLASNGKINGLYIRPGIAPRVA